MAYTAPLFVVRFDQFKVFPFSNQHSLTEFEKAVPGETELLPWFWDEGSEPFGDCPCIHCCLERAEHEVQCANVVLSFFRNLIFQAAQSTLV